jgi:hypothetical protein
MTKRSEEAEAFRQAQKEALEELKSDDSGYEDESMAEDSTNTGSRDYTTNSKKTKDLSALPQQLEQEIRLLTQRTSGFIEVEVYADETLVDLTFDSGFNDG